MPMAEPELNTVRVPCDPAQVVVNHVSFRVELPTEPVTTPLPQFAAPAPARRRPLVWSGRSAPGDPGASALLQAVRGAGAGVGAAAGRAPANPDAVATQLLPRVPAASSATATVPAPSPAAERGVTVVGPRPPRAVEETRRIPVVPAAGGGTGRGRDDGEHPGHGDRDRRDHRRSAADDGRSPHSRARERERRGRSRQPYHPDRRMSLGLVLLPLRLLLGFIALSAGMGKLTDPVYFDGGERGSLSSWLNGLTPWSVAGPLHDWALAHPVGAGLAVAFTQIIVGVLTIAGLWQRLASGVGIVLSLALLATVSWQQVPAYDTPDVILLAAWSPLLIAGAPVYSLDARLAGEAWRTLGPRATLGELRHRVLRRGAALATLLLGLALLIGSMLGSAVRSSHIPHVPEPGEPPTNHLPGEPLPEDAARERERGKDGDEDDAAADDEEQRKQATPGQDASTPEEEPVEDPAAVEPDVSGEEAVVEGPAPEEAAPPPSPEQSQPAPAEVAPEESSGTADTGGTGEASPEESVPSDQGGEESSPGPLGGLLG
ncbi:DoxX family membrane protein [Streptomyces sp. 4N509B]|uniref:DoxX family membrane protein n=1 Tax=Streptomyces sp. 4N509B TaxID=3457413 RepID=UPI003FD5BA38